MNLYVRGIEFAGRTPTWHRLVALAGCSTWAYWRCLPGIGAQIDASTSLVPDGHICAKCRYVDERDLETDTRSRRVVHISGDHFREVGTGELIELDAHRVWRQQPSHVWSRPW